MGMCKSHGALGFSLCLSICRLLQVGKLEREDEFGVPESLGGVFRRPCY